MNCLIVGHGSIGKRHAHILKELGCNVSIVTSQKLTNYDYFASIEQALNHSSFDYVIIANSTYLHYQSLLELISFGYEGLVLVEKPLFSSSDELPAHTFKNIIVAYNLRFHELLQETKKIISNEKLITFSAYVGQYLPTWRKQVDYRQSYSAMKEKGGGVLRDLSHELDYSLWLCGPCIDVTAIGGQFSQLEINSDDVFSIMMKCQRCPVVNLQMNYLDKCVRREITINTYHDTFFIDLIKGTLSINGKIHFECSEGTAQSYVQQHLALLDDHFKFVPSGLPKAQKRWASNSFCTYDDGKTIVKLIEIIENAALSRAWVNL